jgi:hypothetical protein
MGAESLQQLTRMVKLPTARMHNSRSPRRTGDEEMENGASPIPGSSSMTNWPGLKEKRLRCSGSMIWIW